LKIIKLTIKKQNGFIFEDYASEFLVFIKIPRIPEITIPIETLNKMAFLI
jgi:hypothetical protein